MIAAVIINFNIAEAIALTFIWIASSCNFKQKQKCERAAKDRDPSHFRENTPGGNQSRVLASRGKFQELR